MRVNAIALSRTDILWREGAYFEEPVLPARIGYDAAGVIESVGPEVKILKVGDQVSTFPAVSLLNYTAHGEAAIYPENALLVYPRNLNSREAASVTSGLFAAYFALIELAGLQPNQYVVIHSGQFFDGNRCDSAGQSMGAKIVAVTRSEEKGQHLDHCGADHVVLCRH